MIKKTIALLIVFVSIFLTVGCYYRDIGEVDESLQKFADYVIDHSSSGIVLSASQRSSSSIVLCVIVPSEDVSEQYIIVNSVITAVNDYFGVDKGLFTDCLVTVYFSLPINRYSGEPGEQLLEVSNWLYDDVFADQLIEINPGVYGYDSIKRTYNIPDIEFDGVHIINQELRSNEAIVEYISSWPSIDTVYVSTTEQAEELQSQYANIMFIAIE